MIVNLIKLYWLLVTDKHLEQESEWHSGWLLVSDPLADSEQTKESLGILSKYIEPEMARRGL